jgi:hypothetical protein
MKVVTLLNWIPLAAIVCYAEVVVLDLIWHGKTGGACERRSVSSKALQAFRYLREYYGWSH